MRTSAAVSFALLGLAVATPVPQDIDFDAYHAIPVLDDLSAPVGAAVTSTVSYDATAAASSVCILSNLTILSPNNHSSISGNGADYNGIGCSSRDSSTS